MKEKDRVEHILDLLQKVYGLPERKPHGRLVDSLVGTILSQNTSDRNSEQAFENLVNRFQSWDDVLAVDQKKLAEVIRSGGLANQKAWTIQTTLRELKKRFGKVTLKPLEKMEIAEATSFLTSIKGVGEKTANCVLLFAMGRDVFPVDTHVLRVTKRLGWLDEKASAKDAHARLAKMIPKERYLEGHINLIKLGRVQCKARQPKCTSCVLIKSCPSGSKL